MAIEGVEIGGLGGVAAKFGDARGQRFQQADQRVDADAIFARRSFLGLAVEVAAVADLRNELTTGFPIVLVAAALGAYLLAAAALRPVERMRARAAGISATDADARLPVPPTRDEIHHLGTTFNELLQRLHDALERERQFVSDAGHELRTPLGLLTTELELALRRPRSNEELIAATRSHVITGQVPTVMPVARHVTNAPLRATIACGAGSSSPSAMATRDASSGRRI